MKLLQCLQKWLLKIKGENVIHYLCGSEALPLPLSAEEEAEALRKLEAGEDPAVAAARELEEETGLTAEGLDLLTILYPSPGYTNEKIYIFEAKGIGVGTRHPDKDEFLNVEYVSFEEAIGMIARGEIRDAKTVTALLLHKNRG